MKFELKGMEELLEALEKKADAKDKARGIIRDHTARLHQAAQRKAVFRGHYVRGRGGAKVFVPPTGNLKRNIRLYIEDGGMTGKVKAEAEYSGYVELGTRFMSAQPYLEPALREIEGPFKDDLERLVKE